MEALAVASACNTMLTFVLHAANLDDARAAAIYSHVQQQSSRFSDFRQQNVAGDVNGVLHG